MKSKARCTCRPLSRLIDLDYDSVTDKPRMHESGARNLRNVERFLIVPPLAGTFGVTQVAVSDISSKGGRFRHESPLETGAKAILKLAEGRVAPLVLEAVIVWTQ